MLVAVLLGLVIGLALGSLGGGGSILAVPVLVYAAGLPVSTATATSLVAVGAAAAVGALGHARGGHIRWGAATAFIVTAVPGSWAGAAVSSRIDGDLLLLLFSGLILVAAQRMLTACPSCTRVGEELAVRGTAPAGSSALGVAVPATGARSALRRVVGETSWASAARIVVAGTAVGFLTGLFGVGGGFVIVPALTLALGLSMPAAIATSLVVVVGNATVALAFRGVDAVDWGVAVPFTVTMLAGSYVGARIAHRLPPERSLHAFAGLLVLVAVGNGVAAGLALAG